MRQTVRYMVFLLLVMTGCCLYAQTPVDPVDDVPDVPEERECDSILVNLYDWQLLVNNAALQSLYPGSVVTAYMWFKDGERIEDAVEDEYSELERLEGSFQVLLVLQSGDTICSNIVTILPLPEVPPTEVRVYNANGRLVLQTATTDRLQAILPKGIYLVRIEQGSTVSSRKIFIP